jgi:hypothetical protein
MIGIPDLKPVQSVVVSICAGAAAVGPDDHLPGAVWTTAALGGVH